jgi:hypothetical protein
MEITPDFEPVRAALSDCGVALVKLEKTCCIPDRSPCIEEIGETLRNAATTLNAAVDEPSTLGILVATLEDAGAQVGRLQVGCCAPNRMSLYARVLEGLTTAQLAVNHALGKGH